MNIERINKQRVNTKTIFDLDKDNLEHNSYERRMLVYSTLMNEKIFIEYPGKETIRNNPMPKDTCPGLANSEGMVELDASFGDIWDVLDNLGKSHKAYLPILAAVLIHMSCMCNYREVTSDRECWDINVADEGDMPDMTEENLRYHLKKLTDDGLICRFEPGVYYFPKTNILGEAMSLSADTVAMHKYINRKGKRIGYYSGYTLANRMGLSTQVPFTQEITSNNAPAAVREITIKGNRYIVRRPVVEITEENVAVLQLLDCLKDIEKCAEEEPEICGKVLTKYVQEHAITKKMIDSFIVNYPLKIYKAIYETGVEYVSA